MKNIINKMMFLMALGCVEQTSCDWLSTWNAFKDDAGSKWHEFKGKVEDKWHNFENKSNNETIIQKFDANEMKSFFNDPKRESFSLKSSTGKRIKFDKLFPEKTGAGGSTLLEIYVDDKMIYGATKMMFKDSELSELYTRILISSLLEHNSITANELLSVLISLGIKATDDFDTFITLVDDVKSGGKSAYCVFKNNNDEFIIFEKTQDDRLLFATIPKNSSDVYKSFFADEQEIQPYFTEGQLKVIKRKVGK